MRRRIMKGMGRRYVVVSIVMIVIHPVNVQFAMPMSMFGPPPPPPPPPAMFAVAPVPPPPPQPPVFALPPPPLQVAYLPAQTAPPPPLPPVNNNMAVAYPVPMQMPMQVAVPASPSASCGARPGLPCPPCPPCLCTPSCTPAFFSYCSPCHQQCRCKVGMDVPRPLPPIAPLPAPGPAVPMPMPMGPPSVLVVPVPPMMPRRPPPPRYESCSRESDSSDDSSSSSDTSGYRRRGNHHSGNHFQKRKFRKFNRRRTVMFRRHNSDDDDTIIKPVLSFVNKHGDIKINKQLNDYDVAALLGENTNNNFVQQAPQQQQSQRAPKRIQNVKVLSEDEDDKKGQVLVISDFNDKDSNGIRTDFVPATEQPANQQQEQKKLRSGRKQLIFKPPDNKKISNFSVSFQVV